MVYLIKKDRMANAQLIQMAKDLGKSQGFNDIGGAFEQSFTKWVDKVETQVQERETKRKEGDAKVAKFMANLPSDATLPKIPASAKNTVAAYLKDTRMKYADHAKALRDLDAKDETYQEHVSEMNKITADWDNLNQQFTKLVDKRAEYLTLKDTGAVSKGNSPEEVALWSSIVTDQGMDISIQDGFLNIGTGDKVVALDDLPGITQVDNDTIKELQSISDELMKNNLEVTDSNREKIKYDIRQEVISNGMDSVRSIATDSAYGVEGGLKLSHDLLYNPEREEELIETVVEQWLAITEQATKDYKTQQENLWKKKHPVKPTPKKYSLDKFLLDN